MVLEETQDGLIDRCKATHNAPLGEGEEGSDAFRALFERYKDKIYSIALRYSGDPATAQDITQETFLKLFAGIGTFRGSGRHGDANFDSWLYRLVVNACFDQKRKTRRLMPLVDGFLDLLHSPGTSALDEVLRSEMTLQVRTVVESLPADQRMVIVLRYTQGLSYEEIAAILGCPAGTIASRLSRVHKVLERRLKRLARHSPRTGEKKNV